MKRDLVLAALGLARPALSALLTHFEGRERVEQLPEGWAHTTTKRAPRQSDVVPISISIRHDGLEKLKTRLLETSDPSHADYGKHLTKDEVRELRMPSPEKMDLILGWLGEHGVDDAQVRNDWVDFNATVGQVKTLFGADLDYYSYMGSNAVLRTREYGVPQGEVAEAVQFVYPLATFVRPRDERTHARHFKRSMISMVEGQDATEHSSSATGTLGHGTSRLTALATDPGASAPKVDQEPASRACPNTVEPQCLAEWYNIDYDVPDGESKALYGIAGFLEQYIYHPDTETWRQDWAPHLPEEAARIPIELVNGGEDPQVMSKAGVEASLDVQIALPIAYPSRLVYYSTGGRGVKLDQDGNPLPPERTDNEPYLEFFEHLLAKEDDELPHVLAFSYADNEFSVPKEYAVKVCDLMAAVAARGVTMFAATGDGGARGVSTNPCLTNDGKYEKRMWAGFPATCPYITAVGATNQAQPPEVASFSTGGFSQFFDRPKWQDGVLDSYFKQLNGSLDGLFNKNGRAVPDISAVGTNFEIRYGGGPGKGSGTSASTPVLGGMFARIMDARLRAGKGRLGWINPILYTEPVIAILEDVTRGETTGCAWDDGEAPGGWPALKGYDCAVGLGVPSDFQKLMTLFMAVGDKEQPDGQDGEEEKPQNAQEEGKTITETPIEEPTTVPVVEVATPMPPVYATGVPK